MKRSYAVLVPVFLGILFLAGSCADVLNPPDEAGQASAGKGRLSVQIEGAARTVLPPGVFDRYVLRFEYGGAEGYAHADTEWSAALNVELEPGNWTVHADAYIGETAVGTGSAPVTVSAGSVAPVTVRITAIKTGPGVKGTLKYTVNYPANDADHAYTPGDLKVFSVEDWIDGVMNTPVTAPVVNGTAGTVELEAGVYVVYIHIEDSIQRTAVTKINTVHIYGGQESALNVSVGAGEFTAFIPITGTANLTVPDVLTGFLTINSRVIKAYSDPACGTLSLLTESALVNGGGAAEFTLWASSAQGTVYLRQELEMHIDNKTFTRFGTVQTVVIPPNGNEPIALASPVSDEVFEISLTGVGGSVSAGGSLALAGTTITVTVTPDSGYALGTLKYNDGSDHVISGPPYTFTMPAAHITVRAEFERLYNVTAPALAGGSISADESSAVAGAVITLTVTPDFGYAPGTLKYNDGSDHVISGPPYTFTMPASDVTVSAVFVSLTRYVTETGTGTGQSWETASGDLQAMMDELAALYDSGLYSGPFVVKAGAGTYKPQYTPTNAISANGTPERTTTPSTTDRDSTFILRKGVQVWGGYPASGGDDASRNITAHETILSGDIGTPNDSSDNAHHVVVGLGVDHKTVLSGLTITGGNANGSSYITAFGSYTVLRDRGGGIYSGVNTSDEHSPVLIGVRISGNYSSSWGGGMHNYRNRAVLLNVLVSGNSSGSRGGGISNVTYTNLFVINSTLSGNYSSSSGSLGSLANDNSTPKIMNSVIWGNTGGIYDSSSSTSTVSNSIVEGGFTGTGNQNVDPSFAGPVSPSATPSAGGDYRLNSGSQAIDVGDDVNYPDTWTKWQSIIGGGGITTEAEYNAYIAPHIGKDLDGNTRIQGAAIDMGAYEKE